jgi:hypothetical protein
MPDEMRGAGAPQGLSWSWDLDFDALMECLSETGARGLGNSGAALSGTGRSPASAGPNSAGPAPGAAASAAPSPASATTAPAGPTPASPAPSPAVASAAAAPASADPAPNAASAGPTPSPASATTAPTRPAAVGSASADPASACASFSGRPCDAATDAEDAVQDAVTTDPDDREEYAGQRIPAWALAGRIAERLTPGPDLVAWLAMAPASSLADGDLGVVAGSWRRIASWAQARELAAVAQIASRAAAREQDIGTDTDGRPARIPVAAAAEVALELTMSQYGAAGWTDLAVALTWRLVGTGTALAAGLIDLHRARLIAEATSMLTDDAARAVEEKVLPAAGNQTTGMLRAALRRAMIAADPQGAEERRKESERRAKVVLYPDEEHTATLAGQRLPAIHAAAAMARIKAMARALKSSGAGGGMDLLCAQIYLGLLLGTQPPIPPAEGAPPGDGPADEPGEYPPGSLGGDLAGESQRDDGPRDGRARDDGPRDDGPRDGRARDDGPRDDGPRDDVLGDDVPPPGDQDAPRDDYADPDDPPRSGWAGRGQDDDDDEGRPAGAWPALPGLPPVIPPAFARAGDWRPAAGLLDLSLPWQVLAGTSPGPGYLGRIGPLTADQARRLATCAARDPGAEWRIIVTTSGGQAIAVTRIPSPRDGPRQRAGGTRPGAGIGLVSRVTLTIPEDILTHPPPLSAAPTGAGPDQSGRILYLALRAAGRAAARARAAAAADAAAGGCAHTSASPGYRPPPRLKEYIAARDLTCRYPICRQPAWRGDLDHTIPFDDGGLTCRCNLGGVCRTHHILKHHPDWKLEQTAPGIFTWTTPSGRTFTVTPDTHPL